MFPTVANYVLKDSTLCLIYIRECGKESNLQSIRPTFFHMVVPGMFPKGKALIYRSEHVARRSSEIDEWV